jgi:UDP-3-O-[3-hydroxymyristoyl] N-acetylglucosamine deacetylase/3-hydroxyacyl-[acyl-carrier-protein] dehydratase
LELRASNELARHKLLDLLGDFALLGMRIKGRVWASRPGHYANTEFMKQLLVSIRRDGEKPAFKYSPSKKPILDINDVRKLLPHRYPFLLIDKVFHIDDKSIGAIKNITANEPQFSGHFPEEPVMPGVLLVEAMAQAGGIIAMKGVENPEEYSTYFLRIDGVRFKRKVVPGDTMQIEAHMIEPLRRGIASIIGKIFVGGQLACEAVLTAQIAKNR